MGTKVYVGNLSYDTTEEGLSAEFSGLKIASVNIVKYSDTGRSKGFGFIEFETEEDAQNALAKNGTVVDGREIVVSEPRPAEERSSKKLYVGNLSYDVTADDLRAAFEKYGEIVDVTVLVFEDTGKSRGFGFVEYANEEDAQKALEMDSQDMAGRPLKVNLAMPKKKGPRRFER